MVKQLMLGYILITIANHAQAADNWDLTDKILMGIAAYEIIDDVRGTHHALRHCAHETNPIYGTRNPSDAQLALGALTAITALWITANIIPSDWRKIGLSGLISVEYGFARRGWQASCSNLPKTEDNTSLWKEAAVNAGIGFGVGFALTLKF